MPWVTGLKTRKYGDASVPVPGDPLPAVVVGGDVPVDELVEEVARADRPPHVQVLGEEAGGDHPDPVVHPALVRQLAHPGVDDREAGGPGAPGLDRVVRLVVPHARQGRLEVGPGRRRGGARGRRRRTRARRSRSRRCARPCRACRRCRPAASAGARRRGGGRGTGGRCRRRPGGRGRCRSRSIRSSRKCRQRRHAASSPGVGMPAGPVPAASSSSRVARSSESRATRSGSRGVGAGSTQPWARQAFAYGVNTW